MSRSAPAVLLLLLPLLSGAAAGACEVCSVYTFLEIRQTSSGWYSGLFSQASDLATLREGSQAVANPSDQWLESFTSQAFAGYQLSPRFGLQLNVPYIDRSYRRVAPDVAETEEHEEVSLEGEPLEQEPAIETGSESGLGDVALVAQFRALERHDTTTNLVWSLFAGVELPTGDSDRLAEQHAHEEEEGEHAASARAGVLAARIAAHPRPHGGEEHGEASAVVGHELALGSGSTDFLAGTSLFWSRGRAFVDASAQYALRQEGDFDYRFGDELTWAISGGGFVALAHDRSLGFAAQLSGEEKEEDRADGEIEEGTDVSAVYAGPTLFASLSSRMVAELDVAFPLSQESSGTALFPDWRARLALTARF